MLPPVPCICRHVRSVQLFQQNNEIKKKNHKKNKMLKVFAGHMQINFQQTVVLHETARHFLLFSSPLSVSLGFSFSSGSFSSIWCSLLSVRMCSNSPVHCVVRFASMHTLNPRNSSRINAQEAFFTMSSSSRMHNIIQLKWRQGKKRNKWKEKSKWIALVLVALALGNVYCANARTLHNIQFVNGKNVFVY